MASVALGAVSESGGASGGVAVLARSDIRVAAAPAPLGGWHHGAVGVLVPGRLVAAHVQWGPPGGIVVVRAYLYTSVGPEDEGNIGLLRCLSTRKMRQARLIDPLHGCDGAAAAALS